MPIKHFPNLRLHQWIAKKISEHDSDACLLWPYAIAPKGYGVVRLNGRNVGVHRYAFFLTYGHWPEPCGLHSCDTPACFNPRHISEGTKADNNADMHRKGRDKFMQAGENHIKAILTPQQVISIRSEYRPWIRTNSLNALGRKYGVTGYNIYMIVSGKSWKHLL